MKKLFLIITMMLFLFPIVFANDWGIVGEPTQLWSDITNGSSFYNSSSANITIIAPNGTTIASNLFRDR